MCQKIRTYLWLTLWNSSMVPSEASQAIRSSCFVLAKVFATLKRNIHSLNRTCHSDLWSSCWNLRLVAALAAALTPRFVIAPGTVGIARGTWHWFGNWERSWPAFSVFHTISKDRCKPVKDWMGHAHGCTQRHPHPETCYRSAMASIRSTCVPHDPGEHTFDFQHQWFLNAYLAQIRAFLNFFLFHRYGSILWRRTTSEPYLPFHCLLLYCSDREVLYHEWPSYGTLTRH